MNRDLAGWLRSALIPGLLGLACWAPQASASSFCQVINNPDGTPRSGSVADGGSVDLNDVSWASNVGDTVSFEISNITAGSTGYFSGADISTSFDDAGAFQETVGNYYSGGAGSISLSSDTGGFDYTISCASALPVLTSVSPDSGAVGSSVTLSGQSLYGFDGEVSVTIGGVAATITENRGDTVTVTVPTLVAGTYDVSVTTDAGNSSLPGAFTVVAADNTPPVVTAIDRLDASPTNAGSVRYGVSFSEAVTGVDATDFALTASGTAAGTVASVTTTDSSDYTVTVNGVAGDGSLRLDLNGSGTGIIDDAGNAAAGFTGGQAYAVDNTAPAVTSVSVPANGRYFENDNLDFTVHMSESLTVNTAGGTPRLALTLGAGTRYASYLTGSGTSALLFRYTVQSGDRDDDGVVLGASIETNGGTLRDAVGNDVAPALNAVGDTSGVLVGNSAQTIDFGTQAAQSFVSGGTFALDPVATASSGLPVSYTTQTAAVCTISGAMVTMQSAGTCTIAADQAGDASYAAAPTVTRDIAIGQAAQAITAFVADPAAPAFVPEGTFTVSATGGASGNPLLFGTATPTVCAVSGNTVTMQSAGTCALTADQAGDTNYSPAPQASLDVVIGAGSQTITFGAQEERTFVGGGTFALDPVATASSGLPVSYTTQSAAVCTISGSTVTMQSAGTCTIAADQAGSDDYAAAATVTRAIAIGKAAQAITGFVANPEAPTFASGGTFAVSATGGDSANPVVFTSTSSQVCAVSGSTVTMQSAGTCALTADQAGNDDYAPAAQATLEVAIAAAAPTLAWLDDLQKVLGEPDFDLPDPSSDSTGAFSFESSNAEVATVSGSTVTIVGTGTTMLVATQAAKGNYTEGTVSLILAVMTRPDPTLDPEVVGGLQAQVDASVRFANAQQDNVRGRLRQLRDGRGNPSANNVTFSASAGHGPGLSLGAEQVAGGMPALAHGWGLWMAGTISLGERDTRGGANGFDFRSDGVTLGVDRLFGEQLVLGVAGGLGWNDTDFDDSPSQQEARQRSVAFYGLWRGDGPLFVDGQLGLGRLDFDLWRWSTVADATAQARRDGDQLFGGLTFGYEHAGEHGRLAGYGRYDASHTTLDAYRERGLGIYDLSYDRQTIDNSTLALGVEGSHQFKTAAGSLRPFWSVEYRQALENRGDARLNYVLLPVAQDYLLGMRSYNDDTLAFGAGLDIDLDSGWSLSFLLRREQSSGVSSANSFGLRFSHGQASTMPRGLDPTQTHDPRWGQSMQP